MKSRMLRALIVFFFAAPSLAVAGISSYFCQTTEAYGLSDDGSLRIDDAYTNHLQGEPFSVERVSGRIVSNFHTNNSPRVIWNPTDGDGNNYKVVDFGISNVNAFASVLIIKEGVESLAKPFIWHWDTMVFIGTCK